MGRILDQLEGKDPDDSGAGVRCPLCTRTSEPGRHCRHVRWTFEQGGPLDFARAALLGSPYTRLKGYRAADIPPNWWFERGDQIVDLVLLHFDATEGFVFGELAHLDLLARDLWREFRPEPASVAVARR